MNKRPRNRLVGVTAIVLMLVGVILYTTMQSNGAYSKSVDEVLKDQSLVGKRVRVSGSVVPGSWDKGSNPMLFAIKAENGGGGGVLKVSYKGAAPNTFGDGVVAIVTGELKPGGTIESSDMSAGLRITTPGWLPRIESSPSWCMISPNSGCNSYR